MSSVIVSSIAPATAMPAEASLMMAKTDREDSAGSSRDASEL